MISTWLVVPAHSRSKDGVASLAYVAGIHVLNAEASKGVDGRNKSGHDEPLVRSQLVRLGP
jgi:hypothetical protein